MTEEQIVKEMKQDKLELRQMAKGQVCYTLTTYEFGALDHPELFVLRVKKLKEIVEKELAASETPTDMRR